MSQIPVPTRLELKTAKSVFQAWNAFRRNWDNYEIATGLHQKEKNIRFATFLSVVGPDGLEKYDCFNFRNAEEKKDIDAVLKK